MQCLWSPEEPLRIDSRAMELKEVKAIGKVIVTVVLPGAGKYPHCYAPTANQR